MQNYYVCINYGAKMYSRFLPAIDEIEAAREALRDFLIKEPDAPITHIRTYDESIEKDSTQQPLFQGEYIEGMNIRKLFRLE